MKALISARVMFCLLVVCLAEFAARAQTSGGWFVRGTGTNLTYCSEVIPLDGQPGVTNAPNLATTLAGRWSISALYHYNATNTGSQNNVNNRLAITNAVAAFGGKYAGSPLYLGQAYHFGLHAGDFSEIPDVLVTWVDRNSGALVSYNYLPLPLPTNPTDWATFLQNGASRTFTNEVTGLALTISQTPYDSWGSIMNGALELTVVADPSSTNYEYTVWMFGAVNAGSSSYAMVVDRTDLGTFSPLATLTFDAQPPSLPSFVIQPQFEGKPLPPSYEGKSLTELLAVQATVTNAVTNAALGWLDLDNSPELREHPVLDQFVSDMGSNALALASYVFNQIELCDALAYNGNTNQFLASSINLGGVNRSAYSTYLEGEGSPVEQCALLIYLLRRAGVPACYIYPPTNGVQMLDARLSSLLRMQIKGAVNQNNGQVYTTNSLINVNYPWVAAYLNGQWVHLFPWLKDTEVSEGLNLFDYLPDDYNNDYKWIRQYLTGDTNIYSLNTESDLPSVLFPLFVQNALLTSAPGVSLDDLGTHAVNRQVQFARWSDFPTPFAVTNGAVNAVHDLTSITNLYPAWTNIFDTVSVRVYSTANTNKSLYTHDLRMCDLQDRKFIIRHQATNSSYNLILSLAPYRPSLSNAMAFTNDAALLHQETLQTTLTTSDDALNVTFISKRHRGEPSGSATNSEWAFYLGLHEQLMTTNTRSLRLGDLGAICMHSGRVSQKMLMPWAQEYWAMQQAVAANPAMTNSLSPDVTQGTLPYLMGMAYYERFTHFRDQLAGWHKVQVGTEIGQGLSVLSAQRATNGTLVSPLTLHHPHVDMMESEVLVLANCTLRPDESADPTEACDGFRRLSVTEASAQEHKVLEDFYGVPGAISSVRLLRQAQQAGQPGMVELNYDNYSSYTGLHTNDSGIWNAVVAAFTAPTNTMTSVFITLKPITNSVVGYQGVGALIYAWGTMSALISGNGLPANGGWGMPLSDPIYNPPDFGDINLSFNTSVDNSWSVGYFDPVIPPARPPPLAESVSWWDAGTTYNNFSSYSYGGQNRAQQQQFDVAASCLGFSGAAAYEDTVNYGGDYTPQVGVQHAQLASTVADPVNAVTGEFYIEADDLRLPGPMPLLIRRNYSSQNVDLGDSQFGYGWRPAYQPYLRLVTNNVIYAAETDGTVVAYRQPVARTNFWRPTAADNPQLNNRSAAGIGSTANLFNNYITTNVAVGVTNYYLNGADGSVRRFQVMAFPVTGTSGNFDRTRPYLQTWTDANSNSYSFTYEMDSAQPDFGQLRRIQSSNGNFLDFYFDVFGHIVQALTGDERVLNYDYDDHGDLVTVTLPDESQINYTYQHTTGVTNGVTNVFSTHLIVNEAKPDGRQLANTYDSLRRVVKQAATCGSDLSLVTNATFIYSNNVTSLTNTLITGSTYIKDVFGRTNTYQYAGNLITNIVDALGQTNSQVWFSNTNDPGYYPNSLKSLTDKRNLRTDYQYDARGNLALVVLTGNLTGGGSTSETATNSFTYTSANVVSTATDAGGNQMVYSYTNTACPLLPSAIVKQANGVPVSTNLYFYTNVVQAVTNGAVMTNSAFGLLQRMVRGGSAIKDSFYDGRGFLTQTIAYTGTSDPAVTSTFFYTARGELEQQIDGAGRSVWFAYDAMGRRTEEEVYEANASTPLAWKYSYYNDNGELEWTDGPRYNPEDYVWRDYDGAGRKITEIHWRSEAKPDGSGLQAPADGNLYATTFYQYDPFNNLTNVIDPLGNYVVRQYDGLGQLTNEVAYSAAGVALATNSFGYEPGGERSRIVNPLGGPTTRQFTSRGKVMAQTNPDGSTNGWSYYLDGRVRKEYLANGNYWETIYDDANLRVTKYFHNGAGILASNVVQLDARGNMLARTDEEGNTFTNAFDGLDRLKAATGPVIAVVSLNWDFTTYTTNITQQLTAYLYDASGRVLTTTNALGETTVTTTDALGRVTQLACYGSNTVTPVRVTTYAYGTNNGSVTVTSGSDGGAITTTTYTDNDGHPVLAVAYPTNGIQEYVLHKYDSAGNRVARQQCSASGSAVTVWATNGWTYDGLNRVLTETNRDGAYVVYGRDALGDVLSRAMPGGLTWRATYYNDGRIATEHETGGSLTSRSMTYAYYGAGSPFAGLLQSVTDGRGTTRTSSYDDWLRLSSLSTSGTAPEQQASITYKYDRRNLLTNLVQSFNSTNTGPTTTISRTLDLYGQVTSEAVTLGGPRLSSIVQTWDAAGRRTMLDFGSQNYGFRYQADGLMLAADGSAFSYADNGLLTVRSNNYRIYMVAQRDGAGRVLQTQTKVFLSTNLTESLTWRNDGRLSSYTAVRAGDFTDTRSYAYAPWSQRLTQESFNVSSSLRFTNTYTFDNGQAAGLGVLTSIGTPAQSTNTWSAPASGGLDNLGRVAKEQTAILRRPATGLALGAASVSATLDGGPVNVQFDGTDAEGRWRATVDMTPGSHTLRLAAQHPSGQYTAYATNTFNVTGGADTVNDSFDGNGNTTQRVWLGSNGQTNRTQALTWDAFDRLIKVSERDSVGSGQDWVAVFDGLGRKVRTITTLVVSNTPITTPADAVSTVDSWFDPQVEFQEVGVVVNGGVFNMKTYGPDANGVHGGLQGVGGLERVTPYGHISGIGLLQDYFGNIVGSVTNALYGVTWNPARFSSIGPVPGYQSPALTINASLAQAVGWRGKHMEAIGTFHWGARPYEPASGRFLAHDPLFDLANPNGFSACGGDMLKNFDADARFGKPSTGPEAPFSEYTLNTQHEALLDELYGQRVRATDIVAGLVNFGAGVLTMPVDMAFGMGSYVNTTFTGQDDEGNQVSGLRQAWAAANVILVFIPADTVVEAGIQGFRELGAVERGLAAGVEEGTLAAEGPTLFRGTSAGFPGSPALQRIGVTPTSTDPVVATIFATESANYGEAVLHIASPQALRGVELLEGNVLAGLEREVGVGLTPSQFAARADATISAAQARGILQNMGVSLPTQIANPGALNTVLQNAPRLSSAQIQQFINAARRL